MKLAFYCSYLNHHQVLVADELYKLIGDDYVFVTTLPRDEMELKGGADYSTRPYCLLAGETEENHRKAMNLLVEADVAFIGGGNLEYETIRARTGKLTFEVSERWLKKGWFNLLSPRILKNIFCYFKYFQNQPVYKLCQSAFVASDHSRLRMFDNKCFKWAYFTAVKEYYCKDYLKPETILKHGSSERHVRLIWCARFIDWKHPEMAVELANRLKAVGYKFQLDMYGDGVLRPSIQKMVVGYGLVDCVCLKGNVTNVQIQQAMADSDIFLFTSDKEEGWGAVANEAMSNKCCLVGSDEIGAVPYLVKDGINGLIFKSKSVDSLYEKVTYLLDNPSERKQIAEKGYQDMLNIWSPKNAAKSLLTLIKDLQAGRDTSIKEGPCSKA